MISRISTVFAMLFRINTSLMVVKQRHISSNWVDDHKKKRSSNSKWHRKNGWDPLSANLTISRKQAIFSCYPIRKFPNAEFVRLRNFCVIKGCHFSTIKETSRHKVWFFKREEARSSFCHHGRSFQRPYDCRERSCPERPCDRFAIDRSPCLPVEKIGGEPIRAQIM